MNATDDGHLVVADHIGLGTRAVVSRTPASNATDDGRPAPADHIGPNMSAVVGRAPTKKRRGATNAVGDGLLVSADHIGLRKCAVADRAHLIRDIANAHRQRVFAMNQRKRLDLALGAYLRMQLGWHKDLPERQRAKIAKEAAAVVKAGEDPLVVATALAREPFDAIEQDALRDLAELAEQLPVWQSFGAPIRGFGRGSLAVIVAEAGELANYPTHSALWKRCGLAVLDGRRQGDPVTQTSAEWLRHGYSPRRRSLLWTIGDALIKGNGAGRYRSAYLQRKAYELARDPELRPIIAHRRAQRYMEKKLLRDLWNAWRRADHAKPH